MPQQNTVELRPQIVAGTVARIIEATGIGQGLNKRSLPHTGLIWGGIFLFVFLLFGLVMLPPLILGPSSALAQQIQTLLLPLLLPLLVIAPIGGVLIQLYLLVRELHGRRYIIGPESVTHQDTFLGRSQATVNRQDITNITVDQPFYQRAFGTGNVHIETARSSDIVFRYIENPTEVAQYIENPGRR